MPAAPRHGVGFTAVVTVLSIAGAAVMSTVIGMSGRPGLLLLATVLAALPVGPLVGCYLWLDRYEPRTLLVAGLLWGGVVATAGALVLQAAGGYVGGLSPDSLLRWGAPLTEEATKGAFLVLLLWLRRDELDGILDGIVYAGMVGIGFAFVENILYLMAAYTGGDGLGPGGPEALTATFALRGLASPFAHPLFTTFIGIGVGLAVNSRGGLLRWPAPLVGYVVAVAAHAMWNGSTVGGVESFVSVYVVVMVPIFVMLLVGAIWSRIWEGKILAAALADAARRGLLPVTDIPWLVDLGARHRARRWARQTAGREAEQAMRYYQQAAVELGFLHHRFLRGSPPRDFVARGQQYVARIATARPYVSFPGQVVPTR
jgi:protease PrsW